MLARITFVLAVVGASITVAGCTGAPDSGGDEESFDGPALHAQVPPGGCCGDPDPGGGGDTDPPPPPSGPDLRPIPNQWGGYCNRTASGSHLVVTLKNVGTTATTVATVTRVQFYPGGIQDIWTPPLAPGQVATLYAAIPAGCYDPDCDFRIAADDGGQIVEIDEYNNYVSWWWCLG